MAWRPWAGAVETHARRRAATLGCLAVLVLLLLTAAPARAEAETAHDGIYESCALQDGVERCIDRLERIRAGGFTAVLNYAEMYATEQDLLAYAAAAERLGIELIHPFKDRPWWGRDSALAEYPALAASCSCGSDRGLTAYVISLLRKQSSTWGYYVADEPADPDAKRVARFSRRVRRYDSVHPRLIVTVGDTRTVAEQLDRFAGSTDVLGADIYPVGTVLPTSTVAAVSSEVREIAAANGDDSAIVLQAFSWDQYPGAAAEVRLPRPTYPTLAQMVKMREMAAGHDLVLWYSYFDVLRSPAPRLNWAALKTAAR